MQGPYIGQEVFACHMMAERNRENIEVNKISNIKDLVLPFSLVKSNLTECINTVSLCHTYSCIFWEERRGEIIYKLITPTSLHK